MNVLNCKSVQVHLSDSVGVGNIDDISPCNLKVEDSDGQNITQDSVDYAAVQSMRNCLCWLQNKASHLAEDEAG